MRQPYKILVLNGPNLRHLGERQPQLYGSQTIQDLRALLQRSLGKKAGMVEISMVQHNSEGAMVSCLEEAHSNGTDGVILNAAAYTHTSLALADCLAWVGLPVVEVHLTNILARNEKIRHKSFIAPYCIGMISGFGLNGYALALYALLAHLNADVCENSGLDFILD